MSVMEGGTSTRSRLCLVCTPRSGSTSLLKCLSFVDREAELWFEPFVIARLARLEFKKQTGRELPTEWTSQCDSDFEQAAKLIYAVNKIQGIPGRNYAYSEIESAIENTKNSTVIVKLMGSSVCACLDYLPSPRLGFKYVFIIRDPYFVIPSYKRASFIAWNALRPGISKKFEDFNLLQDDPYYRSPGSNCCFKNVHTVWTHVREEFGHDPVVIDYADLAVKPEQVLRKICEIGNFSYRDGLLEWDQSPDITASWKNTGGVPRMLTNSLGGFHKTAINSSCFMAHTAGRTERPARDSLDKEVLDVIDEGIDYYTEMYENRYIPK